MPVFLSDEWFAAEVEHLADLPAHKGLGLVVEVTIAKAPDGEITAHQVVTDGQLTGAGHGAPEGKADVELTVQYEDAVAIARGEVDPHVRYMQGRIKLKGDMASLLIHLRPMTTSDEFAKGWAELAAATEFP